MHNACLSANPVCVVAAAVQCHSSTVARHHPLLRFVCYCSCHFHRCCFPAAPHPPPPGQFSTSSTSVSGPNSFYWQGGYWGYCPPPGPLTAAAPAIPIPQNPGGALAGGGTGTVALIRSPQINMEFQTNDARGLAPVLLDAQGTQAGAGRNIVSMQAELGAGVREIKGPWRSAWLCQVYLATTSWSLQPLSCRNSCFPPSPRVCQPCCQPNGCIS